MKGRHHEKQRKKKRFGDRLLMVPRIHSSHILAGVTCVENKVRPIPPKKIGKWLRGDIGVIFKKIYI